MRKNLFFVFGILFILIFSLFFVSGGRFFLDVFSPKNSVSSLEKGLVGHWTLDEINYNPNTNRVTDKSAYSNHGINSGATFTTDRMGNIGGAMSFDGSNDYVKIEKVLVNNPSELTISGWIKKESGGGTYECAFHQGSDSSIGNTAYWFGVDNTDYLTATIGAMTGVGWSAGKTSIKVNYGEWYHLVASWNGNVVRVYVNGNYVKQYNLGTYSTLTTPTRIGASTDGTTYQFKGNIDEVRIYERALSDEEIKLLYDSYKPKVVSSSLQSGLVLDMPLTDTYMKSSNIVTDRTPYSNDGVVNGAIVGNDYTSFDGGTIGISSRGVLDFNSFTISLWVYHTDYVYPRTFTPIKKSNPGCYTSGGKGWDFGHVYSSSSVDVCLGDGTNVIRRSLAFNSGYRPIDLLNSWAHITYIVDRNTNLIYAYVNGVKQNSQIDISTIGDYSNLSPLTFGNLYGWKLDGYLSNLKIYNRALREEEVKSLYERGRV